MNNKTAVNCAVLTEPKSYVHMMSSDLVNDLQDAFDFYDNENKGLISITHFRNIMQNFGYHSIHIRDANEELKKVDAQFIQRNCVDLQFVKEAIAFRMYKGGKDSNGRDEEAKECYGLFDKNNKDKDPKPINYQQIKQTLAPHLKFQVSESDIQEFMEFVGHENGWISFHDFRKFYLS